MTVKLSLLLKPPNYFKFLRICWCYMLSVDSSVLFTHLGFVGSHYSLTL